MGRARTELHSTPSIMPARKGARPNVLRAIELDGLPERFVQTAQCPVCRAELRFGIGSYGQTLEACTNASCVMRHPHRPQPDTLTPPPMTLAEKSEARRAKRRAKALEAPIAPLPLLPED